MYTKLFLLGAHPCLPAGRLFLKVGCFPTLLREGYFKLHVSCIPHLLKSFSNKQMPVNPANIIIIPTK
jgi:hypothetical protein